jgi:hypothetical protein
MPEPSATWEDYTILRHKFPVAVAWGQAASSEGGDVTVVPDAETTA